MEARGPQVKRDPYQGVKNVIRFNYDMYLKAALILLLLLLIPWPSFLLWPVRLGAGAAIYFLVASIIASHYIYDRSELYRWKWFTERFPRPHRIVNLHSGFDETTVQLSTLYPEAEIQSLDFYDQNLMSEPSIERARNLYPNEESLSVSYSELPLENGTESLICVLLAAHELREHQLRVQFFRELTRVLSSEGHLVILEHLRDGANFLAFGPGFFHFFPHSNWSQTLNESGLSISCLLYTSPSPRDQR